MYENFSVEPEISNYIENFVGSFGGETCR